MDNYNKEKVLSYLHLMQNHIKQIEEIIKIKTNEPKIGEIAKNQLKKLLEQRQWSEQEFYNFFDESYSKATFDINYPLLSYNRLDDKQYPRYYKYPILVNDKKCYLCSQWYEHSNSRKMVLDFISRYKGDNNEIF